MNKSAQNSIDVFDVANYFLWRDSQKGDSSDGISNLKLQKLVYYAKGVVLAATDGKVSLFDNEMRAWKYGPVVPDLHEIYKGYGKGMSIPPNPNFKPEVFDTETREILDEVFGLYGQLSAWRLAELTHKESPWKDHCKREGVITDADLKAYFDTIVE